MTNYIFGSYRLNLNYDNLCYVISDIEAEVKTVGVLLVNHYTAEVETIGVLLVSTTTPTPPARDNLLEGRMSVQHNQSDS